MITEQTVFLVVDDMDSMRRINSNQLSSLGARQILLANNGLEALKILDTRRVDVILCDWNMPVMTGFELLLKVRGDERTAHLPFIMITADCEREQVKHKNCANCFRYARDWYTDVARIVEKHHARSRQLAFAA